MKRLRKPTLKILALSVAVIAVAICLAFLYHSARSDSDLPGSVIGNNPNNIPKKDLPVCDFDGTKFVEKPCYSPPGTLYD